MTYQPGQPAGTYDHRAMPCASCEVTCAFYRPYKSQQTWRCTQCNGAEVEDSKDVAPAIPPADAAAPASVEQRDTAHADAGGSPIEERIALAFMRACDSWGGAIKVTPYHRAMAAQWVTELRALGIHVCEVRK